MSIKNTLLGGTDFSTPTDRVKPTDLNDTFDATTRLVFHKLVPGDTNFNVYQAECVMGHDDNTYSMAKQSAIAVTDDDGVTWTEKNTDLTALDLMGLNCEADRTRAFVFQKDSADTHKVAFTTNSGTTWTTGTPIGIDGDIFDSCYTTSGLAFVCGADGGTDYIWKSTDGGSTWAAVTTSPDAPVMAMHMFDDTNGVCVTNEAPGAIWKTTDGGDVWVDTTKDANETWNEACAIRMTSTTAFFMLERHNTVTDLMFFNLGNTTDGITSIPYIPFRGNPGVSTAVASTNIVKATTGNWWFSLKETVRGRVAVFKYDGTDLFMANPSGTDVYDTNLDEKTGRLSEAGDNEMLIMQGGGASTSTIVFKMIDS